MPVIGFRIIAETIDETITLPKALITCGTLTDEILYCYTNDTAPDTTDIPADKIQSLMLIAVDVDTEEVYFEALNPYKYWPVKESEKHASLRAKFRE